MDMPLLVMAIPPSSYCIVNCITFTTISKYFIIYHKQIYLFFIKSGLVLPLGFSLLNIYTYILYTVKCLKQISSQSN